MGLFSSFQRKRDPQRQQRAAVPQDAASAELLRVRARRRLIGAAVLVVLAVIALPMVFESQPRPLDNSIPIVLPNRDGVGTSQPVPAPAPPPAPVQPEPSVASVQTAPQAQVPPSQTAPVASKPQGLAATTSASATRPVTDNAAALKAARERADRADRLAAEKAAADRAASAAAARAAAEKAQAASKVESGTRFVVQVGAFAESSTVREARQRIEKLGLRSSEQDVETASGRRTRVRLGPFSTREEAERALAKLRAAGLPGAVLAI